MTEPDAGNVRIDGELMGIRLGGDGNRMREPARTTNAMRARIGMIFQQFNLWPHLTALGNVTKAQIVVLRRSPTEARARAIAILERVGLGDKLDVYPHELSSGQQQRVAIARAMAMDPRIMLCDEPTASLDPELVQEVLAVLRQLAEDGMTMIIATHELSFAAQVAHRIAFMDQGRIVEQGSPADIIERPKSERLQLFLSRLRRDEPAAAAAH